MSAVLGQADIPTKPPDVRLWARSRLRQLFNNLISAGKERRRHCEAERLGRLEVDHQLEFGRALHRKIGGLLALKDTIDVASRAPVLVGIVDPLTNQTAPGDEDAFEVDRGQLVPDGKRDDQIAMNFLPQSIRVGFSVHTPREAPSVSAARRLTPIGSGKYLLLSHQSPRVGLKISAETRIH